jgi:hypothetical protein
MDHQLPLIASYCSIMDCGVIFRWFHQMQKYFIQTYSCAVCMKHGLMLRVCFDNVEYVFSLDMYGLHYSPSDIGDLSRFWLSCVSQLVFLLANIVRLFGIQMQSLTLSVTWWRLFQKHVVNTKLDIYVFIILNSVSNFNTNDTWLYTLYLHLNLLNIIELYFVQSNLQQ